MSDLCKINVSLLKSYKNEFNSELNNFNNKTYSTFSSSYIKSCSDSYVRSMANKLDTLYSKIKKGYTNIDKWWTDYNDNVEGLENYLAGNGSLGAISESSVRGSASSLPTLKKYNINFANTVSLNASSAVTNASFLNNSVSIDDPFSSVYTDYDVINVDTRSVVNNQNIANKMEEVLATAKENITDWAEGLGNDIKELFDSTAAKIVVFSDNVIGKITDKVEEINDWWTNEIAPKIEEKYPGLLEKLKKVGATLALFRVAIEEGTVDALESMFDALVMLGTIVKSYWTINYDLVRSIFLYIKDGEIDHEFLTIETWEETKAFVAKDFSAEWFNKFYQETEIGNWILENSYYSDTVRSLGAGIGYNIGIQVVAAVCHCNPAVIAGLAGLGRGAEKAWAEDATIGEGLLAGFATAGWESLQFAISQGASNLSSSLARIGIDTGVGALEGFVQPLIESIHKDGYYDDNGNYVEFLEDDNFSTRFKELFDDDGGWKNVGIQAVIGGVTSALSELFGFIKKSIKNQKNSKMFSSVDDSVVVTERLRTYDDIATTQKLYNTQDLEITQDINQGLIDTVKLKTSSVISLAEKNAALNNFKSAFKKGKKSNEDVINFVYDAMEKQINDGNVDALNLINLLTEIKKSDKNFRIIVDKNCTLPYWNDSISAIVLSPEYSNDISTIAHEAGHAIFDRILKTKLPDNWYYTSEKAKAYSQNSGMLFEGINDLYNISSKASYEAKAIYEYNIKSSYGMDIDEYKPYLAKVLEEELTSGSKNSIRKKLAKLGLDENLVNGDIDFSELAEVYIQDNISKIYSKLLNTKYSDYCLASDIVDATFNGKVKDYGGNNIILPFGHYEEYYKDDIFGVTSFHEIFANFSSLKANGKTSQLDFLRKIFKEEYVDVVTEMFNKAVKSIS